MEGYGIIAAVLAFLAAFFFVFALNLILTDVFKSGQAEIRQQSDASLRDYERKKLRASIVSRRDLSLGDLASAAAKDEEPKKTLYMRLNDVCVQSGLAITPPKVLGYGIGVGLFVGLIGGVVTGSIVVGLLAMLIASTFPYMYVNSARKQRTELLRTQLPDAFELISRILRSGQTISQGMSAVADEFKPPVASEFGYTYEQQNLGLNAEVSMRELASRTGLMELKIFAVAVLVHRQAGGNLTELLDKLAHIVRQRLRLRGEIRALTAEGRMQALILLGLPVVVWLAMYFINRPYALKLFEHPQLIIATLVSMVLGALWINKIVNFDF